MSTLQHMRSVPRRGTRYPARMMHRACVLREAGWPVCRVAELLACEFGVEAPHPTTIRRWTEPGFATRQNQEGKERALRRWLERNPPRPHKISDLRATQRMVELRGRRLSWRSIVEVADLFWGLTLTELQVQQRVEAAMREMAA